MAVRTRIRRMGRETGLAIVANAPAPYRVFLHERIADELPLVRLTSIFLAEGNLQDWKFGDLAHIGAVTIGRGEKLGESGGRFSRIPRTIRRIKSTIRELRRSEADTVLVGGYGQIECLAALVWSRLKGKTVLMTADSNAAGDHARGVKRLIKNALVRNVVRLCDAILPCGTQGRRYFARYGAKQERMFNMPYCADVKPIRELSSQKIAEVRGKYGLEVDRRRIVLSGRLIDLKGYDVAIDAFNQIAADRPEWDLVIAGDGELRDQLAARVRPELRDRVIWLGFVEDQEELMAVYRCSDILLHPSRREAWGVVIQEAVAAGMAVIVSDVTGAAPDLVKHGENGFHIPKDDLGATVRTLLDATQLDRIAELKAASAEVYERWETDSDPVQGLAQALHTLHEPATPAPSERDVVLAGLRPAAA